MRSLGRARIPLRWQPAYWATVIGGAMVLTGFGVLLLGWSGVAALSFVDLQVPYGASAGLAGLALIGFGAAVVNMQVTRHLAARERAHTAEAVRLATHLLRVGLPTASSDDMTARERARRERWGSTWS